MAMRHFTGTDTRASTVIEPRAANGRFWRAVLAALLVGLAAPVTASAQTTARNVVDDETFPTDSDVDAINACLNTSTPGFNPAVCIGDISGDCMAVSGNDTTVGMLHCLAREKAAWEVILNLSYRQTLDGLDPAGARALRNAQRRWLETRRADLAVYATHRDGSIHLLNAASYDLTFTAQRAIHLQWVADGG
ncbi:MAG: DUF1311 domain-containing protein [Hyphomonadaceae bacterium]|nr:DUF1311 domain-containing protein [Hyphomonadaceae bacterium]